jgi:rhomboid protease GluP
VRVAVKDPGSPLRRRARRGEGFSLAARAAATFRYVIPALKSHSSGPRGTLVQKLRSVYAPFLLVSVLCVGGYTILNWLLLDEIALFSLDEEVVNLWLPFVLAGVAVFVWIRPRVRALRFGRWDRGAEFYCFMAAGAITAPLIVAQIWLSDAGGGMTHLDSPSALGRGPKTKYYTIGTVSIDKGHSSRYTISSYQGRHNETLQIACYFVCPVRTLSDAEPVWLATSYNERLSSHLTGSDRDAAIRSFMAQAYRQYQAEDLSNFTYFSRAPKNPDLRGYEAALAENPIYRKDAHFTLLLRHTSNFDSRTGSTFGWVFGSFGIGATVWFVLLLFVPIDARAASAVATGRKDTGLRTAMAFERNLFWPHRGFAATPVFIDICILVFVGMALAGLGVVGVSARDLLMVGGNFRPALLDGQVWRLVTSIFIHAGLMHVAGNVVSLIFAGIFLERAMGSIWFTVCFLVSGIAGGITSAVYHPATVAVGASSGIFGLWGVLLVLGLTKSKHTTVPFRPVLTFAAITIGYNLLLGLASAGIDNAAHLGGLAAGVIFGVAARLLPNILLRGATGPRRRGAGHPVVATAD